MKLKSVFLLLAAVAIGLTAYFYSENNGIKALKTNSELIPELQNNLNNVTKFTVKEAGNTLLSSVSKTTDGWVVDNRDGYKANITAVRQVFEKLADAKLMEAKTSNPKNYTRLGVEDVEAENAQGTSLSIEGLSDAVNIIFGNDGSSGKNTQYIRIKGQEQSWLINKKINIAKDPTDWLAKDLLDIPPERIKSIEIEHADGTVITISNTGNEAYEFDLDAIAPEGMKISDSEIYQVANALSSLQLKDVGKLENSNIDESAATISTVFKTFDGLTITSTAYPASESLEEAKFSMEIDFNADHIDENVINAKENNESPSDAAMVSDPKAAEELAKAMTSKLSGWAYIFPTITQSALTKKLDDFFIDEDA